LSVKVIMQLALILPKHRMGLWHERLEQALAQTHAITLFIDESAPPYPRALRGWLTMERLIYRERHFASRATGGTALHSSELDESSFDLVVDLSESSNPRPRSIAVSYDGSPDSLALIDRLLSYGTPHISVIRQDTKETVAQSLPAIDDRSRLTRGLQISYGRCISLIERALRMSRAETVIDLPRPEPPAQRNLPAFIGRFLTTKAPALLLNRILPADQWHAALRGNSSDFVCVGTDGRRSYADPFLYSHRGRTFLFVEECSHATEKGVISAAEVSGDKLVGPPVTVLERPYHLSYPLIVEHAETIYMLPETAANRALELYRAVEFPWKWELASVLIEDMALADATPIFFQDRWWLFASAAEYGTTDQDELFIFHSDKLTGPWVPHARNPVKSDCRSARPAGQIVCSNGRLFRPAQDCLKRYGAGIVWHEIVELSPTRYYEREIVRFDASRVAGIRGLHTVNQSDRLQAVDVNIGRIFGRRQHVIDESISRLSLDLDRAFLDLPHWRGKAGDHCAASCHNLASRVA
jgi:hypothetical protein